MVSKPSLSVGIVPMSDFTMLALSAFVDTLRLAADEGDRSRQIRCRWRIMSEQGRPVRASNGIVIESDGGFVAEAFDYVVVVGGTLHRGPEIGEETRDYLQGVAARGMPMIGLCTGSFVLARLGLLNGRRACVSWFHKAQLESEFPGLRVIADALYVLDRDRITCAGGTGVIHLASHLIDRHLGAGEAAKGLRVMLETGTRAGSSPQPPPALEGYATVSDPRVSRAMLAIEQSLASPIELEKVAQAAGVTTRQLARLFHRSIKMSPRGFAHRLRAEQAQRMVLGGRASMTEIAVECGYSDASHFARDYRRRFGATATNARATRRKGAVL